MSTGFDFRVLCKLVSLQAHNLFYKSVDRFLGYGVESRLDINLDKIQFAMVWAQLRTERFQSVINIANREKRGPELGRVSKLTPRLAGVGGA